MLFAAAQVTPSGSPKTHVRRAAADVTNVEEVDVDRLARVCGRVDAEEGNRELRIASTRPPE